MDCQSREKLAVAVKHYVDSVELKVLKQIAFAYTLEHFYRNAEQTEIEAFFATHLEGES